jgi:hypothetical protein
LPGRGLASLGLSTFIAPSLDQKSLIYPSSNHADDQAQIQAVSVRRHHGFALIPRDACPAPATAPDAADVGGVNADTVEFEWTKYSLEVLLPAPYPPLSCARSCSVRNVSSFPTRHVI